MNQIVKYMSEKMGISPKDAMSLWNMMLVDGKNKGVDLNSIPVNELMKFIDVMMAQKQPSREQMLNKIKGGV